MKKILLLFLTFGLFCFSNTGFKDLKWGVSREEVIKKVGKPVSNEEEFLFYSNINFANLNLKDLGFTFFDNKLRNWIAHAECTPEEYKELIDEYELKYGKLRMYKTKNGYASEHEDSNGVAIFSINFEESAKISKKNDLKYFVILSYYDPNYKELSEKNKKQKYKNEL